MGSVHAVKRQSHLRACNHSAHVFRVLTLLALLVQEYQFTGFTSTGVQMLTPEELLRHIIF
jgi:hypothetical protein